jgi:hypothetical protein
VRRRHRRIIIESRIPLREDLRVVSVKEERDYDALNLIIDVSMFIITGGLWAFWILVRELRR